MEAYRSMGETGITGYDAGSAYIRIFYGDGSVYLYNNTSAGSEKIDEMKRLAQNGHGLEDYINQEVKDRFMRKEK